jgi:hypothetical protein
MHPEILECCDLAFLFECFGQHTFEVRVLPMLGFDFIMHVVHGTQLFFMGGGPAE